MSGNLEEHKGGRRVKEGLGNRGRRRLVLGPMDAGHTKGVGEEDSTGLHPARN